MRNLKKILALVLSLMMVLSVMVTASATDFADDADITNKEAVEVMSALGILSGSQGKFAPKGTLERAQAAKIIAFIKLGADADALLKGTGTKQFSDVTSGWAFDYISYCAGEGLVAGSQGKFFPKNTLTGYVFGKMVLNAAGVEGTYTGSQWKINVATALKKANLLEGLDDLILSANLTREQAAQLAFNAMRYNPAGTSSKYVVTDTDTNKVLYTGTDAVTALLMKSSVKNATLEVTTDYTGSLMAAYGATSVKAEDDVFGNPGTSTWKNAKGEVIYQAYADALLTITDGSFDKAKLTKAGYDFTGADVYYNGTKNDSNVTIDKLAKPGAIVSVYGAAKTTGGYAVSRIVVTEYYFAKITDVKTNGNIELAIEEAGYYYDHSKTHAPAITVAYDKTAAKQSANYVALSGYAKGDVFAICVKGGWETSLTILDTAAVKAVGGKVTATSVDATYNGYIRVDGVKYVLANEYNQAAVTVGATGTFYVLNDCILGYTETAAPTVADQYLFVLAQGAKAAKGSSSDLFETVAGDAAVAQAKVMDLTTGEIKIVTVATDYSESEKDYVYLDKYGKVTTNEVTDEPVAAVGEFWTYTTLEDGSYVLIKKVDTTEVTLKKGTAALDATVSVGGTSYNLIASSATKVTSIDVTTATTGWDKDVKGVKVETLTGVANFPKNDTNVKTTALVLSDKGIVSEIYVVTNNGYKPAETHNYAVFAQKGELTADGQAYGFYVGGKYVEYFTGDKFDATALKAGQLFDLTFTGDVLTKVKGETAVKTGKVTYTDETFFIVDNTVYYYDALNGHTVVDAGDDYVTDTVSVGDTVDIYGTAAAVTYVVIKPAE